MRTPIGGNKLSHAGTRAMRARLSKTRRKVIMRKYVYTSDMSEISGFGGDYEATCRAMVVAGLEYLDKNAAACPEFLGYSNIYGVIQGENAAAKALSEVVVKASKGNCTGAMHQATIAHILWIRKNGWKRYCAESREKKIKGDSHASV